MEIVTLDRAKELGLSRFFTGRPCRKGHIAERSTSNRECLECKRTKDRDLHQKYVEKRREKCRKYHAKERDDRLVKMKEWRTNNRDAAAEHERNRRARKANAEGHHTREDIARLETLQRMKCATCKEDLKDGYHVDHIVPLAAGGTNWPWNLQLLCPTCNLRKRSLDPIEWANRNSLLL